MGKGQFSETEKHQAFKYFLKVAVSYKAILDESDDITS